MTAGRPYALSFAGCARPVGSPDEPLLAAGPARHHEAQEPLR